jgi:hypothetical protein
MNYELFQNSWIIWNFLFWEVSLANVSVWRFSLRFVGEKIIIHRISYKINLFFVQLNIIIRILKELNFLIILPFLKSFNWQICHENFFLEKFWSFFVLKRAISLISFNYPLFEISISLISEQSPNHLFKLELVPNNISNLLQNYLKGNPHNKTKWFFWIIIDILKTIYWTSFIFTNPWKIQQSNEYFYYLSTWKDLFQFTIVKRLSTLFLDKIQME